VPFHDCGYCATQVVPFASLPDTWLPGGAVDRCAVAGVRATAGALELAGPAERAVALEPLDAPGATLAEHDAISQAPVEARITAAREIGDFGGFIPLMLKVARGREPANQLTAPAASQADHGIGGRQT